MTHERDLEHMFEELGYGYEIVGPQMWLLDTAAGGGAGKVVVSYSPPLVVMRLKVADLPGGKDDPQLMRRLLEANAHDLVHGSYGLEGNAVVIVDTLEADYLDVAEFQASVDGIVFAAATLIPWLKEFGIKK